MEHFDQLLAIMDRLLGPGGCPWDQQQTMQSIRSNPIEEACELKEAIELDDNEHITEELGDLFLTAVYMAKLAEKEKRCSIEQVIAGVSDKLIRRHPHVFGSVKVRDSAEVKELWDQIKKGEKGKELRKSALDNIPGGLPVTVRAQKVIKKAHKGNYLPGQAESVATEGELVDALWNLLQQAHHQGIDLEQGLRHKLVAFEADFREYEWQQNKEV